MSLPSPRFRPLRAALAFLVMFSLPALAGGAKAAGEAPSAPGPVVVELFTSQSCSSCPPADAFLGELAGREDVLALSMHVDYWNALGWRDPWSSPKVTARQRDYVRAMGARYVSTPQAVVHGRGYAVGSDRRAVLDLIARARVAAPRTFRPGLGMPEDHLLSISLPEGKPPGPATVWLVAFDDRHTARITGGENSGATITYSNVVRALRPVGTWTGEARTFTVDISPERDGGYGNCAVIVQADGTGPVLGAAALPMAGH